MNTKRPEGALSPANGSVTEVTTREWVVSVLIGTISGKERWGGNFNCESYGEAKSLLDECAKDDPRPWRISLVECTTKTETVYESQNARLTDEPANNTTTPKGN